MSSEGLAIDHLGVAYNARPVLCDISLDALQPGHLTVLIGPNAAGKSTLLRAVAGLVPATGAVRLDGVDLLHARPRERARKVAFLPQSQREDVDLTTLGALVGAAATTSDCSRATLEREALRTLERMGLLDLALSPLAQLSGGQRQMVGLAQAIVRARRLLLLDEPTSALDLRCQEQMMAMMRSLAAEGRVVLAVLHDLSLAARWADRLIALGDGQVRADGPPQAALTPSLLADLYGVSASVEPSPAGGIAIHVTGVV